MLVRISKRFRERGLGGTVKHLFARLREELWSEEVFLVMTKDLSAVAPVRRPTGIVFEDLRREHLPLLYELNRERHAPEVDKRFTAYVEAGFQGFVALLDGAAIGYYWWVDAADGAEFPDLRDHDLGFDLGSGEAYGSDFYILEAHRNGGTAGEMLARIEAGLQERGYSRLWGYVLAENRPARWLYSMRGYEKQWTHMRRKRFFVTKEENSPDPRTDKGGTDVDR
ncbi:MAG: hypothetical protein QOE75_5 [Solirubrobacterales bacterium]|nr:hypothetical protein [Solirubrobacterales bacterium]